MDIQEVSDRLAIRELVERYTLSIVRRDWDTMAACFHENARWHLAGGSYDFQGLAAVREGLIGIVGGMEFLVQMTHGVNIDELTADRAKVTSLINEVARRPGAEGGVFALGIYYDTVTKVGGRWGFEERYFQMHYIDTAAPPGAKVIDYASQP